MESHAAHQDINLAEFISVAIHLSEESGKIIRQVWASGRLGEQQKNEGPVTEADAKVQKTIESNLKAIYPSLVVRGEEEKAATEKHEAVIKPEQVRKNLIKQDLLNAKHKERKEFIEKISKTYEQDGLQPNEFTSFNTANAVVWVDPLDGTSDYVKGNLPAVTVLIGVSINGYSRIGIVHNPFSDEDETKGRTIFGTAEHGVYRLYFEEKMTEEELAKREPEYLPPFDHLEAAPEDHKFVVAASLMHFSPEMEKIIETITPVEIKRIGGAGNKCFNVAYGRVDSYLHPSVGLRYWDLCAPETLIKAMGGYATNIREERLTYHLDGNTKLAGLLLSKNPQLHALCIKRLGAMLGTLKDKFN